MVMVDDERTSPATTISSARSSSGALSMALKSKMPMRASSRSPSTMLAVEFAAPMKMEAKPSWMASKSRMARAMKPVSPATDWSRPKKDCAAPPRR